MLQIQVALKKFSCFVSNAGKNQAPVKLKIVFATQHVQTRKTDKSAAGGCTFLFSLPRQLFTLATKGIFFSRTETNLNECVSGVVAHEPVRWIVVNQRCDDADHDQELQQELSPLSPISFLGSFGRTKQRFRKLESQRKKMVKRIITGHVRRQKIKCSPTQDRKEVIHFSTKLFASRERFCLPIADFKLPVPASWL